MATKIVLNRDVENLGIAGEVVEVKDGYARNFLIPRGYAVKWTKGAQKSIDELIEARRRHEIATVEDAVALRELIEAETEFEVARKAGTSGRLFGAVSPKVIAEVISAKLNRPVDHRRISIDSPIKTTGTYGIVIQLHPEVSVDSSITVVAE